MILRAPRRFLLSRGAASFNAGAVATIIPRRTLSSSEGSIEAAKQAMAAHQSTAERVREQVHPTVKGRSRFYKEVGVREVDGGRYEVTLDGRSLKTPGRRPMHLASEALAWAIAAEWDAQGAVGAATGRAEGINPSTMPLMSLTATWLDQTDEQRGIVMANVNKYLFTDTVCYYAEPVRGDGPAARLRSTRAAAVARGIWPNQQGRRRAVAAQRSGGAAQWRRSAGGEVADSAPLPAAPFICR